jgi:hypothetical protein
MTAQDHIPAANVHAYLSRLQDTATQIAAVLEGVSILMEDGRGMNATHAMVSIALERAGQISSDCDSVNWPDAMAADTGTLPKGEAE